MDPCEVRAVAIALQAHAMAESSSKTTTKNARPVSLCGPILYLESPRRDYTQMQHSQILSVSSTGHHERLPKKSST